MGLYLGLLLRPKLISLILQDPLDAATTNTRSAEPTPRPTTGDDHPPRSSQKAAGERNERSEHEEALRIANLSGPPDIAGSSESLLFVGVMTANAYLATRAAAVHDTWAQDVPGKVSVFVADVGLFGDDCGFD